MMNSCSERMMMMMMMIWCLCLIFFISNSLLVTFASHVKSLCRPDQRDALWDFKNEFYFQGPDSNGEDAEYKTQRWNNNTACCSWPGISCDPNSGMVIELNLRDNFLNGPLRFNSSLFRLKYLQSLDLGQNNISGILPDSIGNLKYLRVLSLDVCYFVGKIPSSLGNLSYLTNLDLSVNGFTGEVPYSMGYLNRLTELRIVVTKLSGNFPSVLLNLTELTYIDLGSNQFHGMLPSNMSSLSKLTEFDVAENSFSGSIPSSLFMLPSLITLNLEMNDFSGPLEIGNISSSSKLGALSLGENNFNGPIPVSISKLVWLKHLDLSYWNTRRGLVDFSIFLRLKSLTLLDLSYLNTRSMVDLSVFSQFPLLRVLDLSGIHLKISSNLLLPSPIYSLSLSSCNIVEFPKFLQNQSNLIYLDISANQIEGQVPEWLWSIPFLQYVNISQNFFRGFEGSMDVIQKSAKAIETLDISSNTFQELPLLPNFIMFFFCSENRFSGEIHGTICDLVAPNTIVLSNNNFNGSIPQCFENFNSTLGVLDLRNNSLSGIFPDECISDQLISLDVGHNQLSGELPKSLINCTYLGFLSVENNKINDTFPFWLRLLPELQILVLRSNEFYGPIHIPNDHLNFPELRIFDISNNRFTGDMPSDYFLGWSAMQPVLDTLRIRYSTHHDLVNLKNKGSHMEVIGSGFTIYKAIDVSGNKLEGNIPESISLLKELVVLDMSNNAFTGGIPPSLSNLTNLQSLDLSQNRLSGKIPSELGKLNFLAWMNFSYNKLEGPIPQGTQFQSQSSSSFKENLGLCGIPLQETCGGEEDTTKQDQDEEDNDKDEVINWIAAAISYVPGLFCGITIGHILTSYKHDWFMKIFYFLRR